MMSTDVLVMGDTFASLVTALEAAREGAEVIVLPEERSSNALDFSRGILTFCPDEELGEINEENEKEKLVEEDFDEEDFYSMIFEFGNTKGNSEHLEKLVDKSGDAVDWLEKNLDTRYQIIEGIPFRYFPEEPVSEKEAKEKLEKMARLKGVSLMEEVTLLELNESLSRSYKIEYVDQEGDAGEIYTRSLVFAGGGYLGDEKLMEEYVPYKNAAPWRKNESSCIISFALEQKLDTTQMNNFKYSFMIDEGGKKLPLLEDGWLVTPEGALPIDKNMSTEFRKEVLELTDDHDLFLVWTRENLVEKFKHLEGIGFGFSLPDEMEEIESLSKLDEKYYEYNLEAEVLQDEIPGDEPLKISRAQLVTDYCLGGIKIDEDFRVMEEGKPIKGYYAAGEMVGGIWGDNALPGAILLEKVLSGLEAGKNAARFALE